MTCDCCGKHPDYEFALVCMDCWTDRNYQKSLIGYEVACTHGR